MARDALEVKQDAAAILRCFRREDYDGMRALLDSYSPDYTPILSATLLLCRGILTALTKGTDDKPDEILATWVAQADPDDPEDGDYRRAAAELVSTSKPASSGMVHVPKTHFALLELASALNDQAAEQGGEDPDEVLDGYLLWLAGGGDDDA